MQIRIHNHVITLDTLVADPDLAPHGSAQLVLVWILTLMRIRIQLFTLMRILLCDHLARGSTMAKLEQHSQAISKNMCTSRYELNLSL